MKINIAKDVRLKGAAAVIVGVALTASLSACGATNLLKGSNSATSNTAANVSVIDVQRVSYVPTDGDPKRDTDGKDAADGSGADATSDQGSDAKPAPYEANGPLDYSGKKAGDVAVKIGESKEFSNGNLTVKATEFLKDSGINQWCSQISIINNTETARDYDLTRSLGLSTIDSGPNSYTIRTIEDVALTGSIRPGGELFGVRVCSPAGEANNRGGYVVLYNENEKVQGADSRLAFVSHLNEGTRTSTEAATSYDDNVATAAGDDYPTDGLAKYAEPRAQDVRVQNYRYVQINNFKVSPTPFTYSANAGEGPGYCTAITMTNKGESPVTFDMITEFDVVDADGGVKVDWVGTGDQYELPNGTLDAGQSRVWRMCIAEADADKAATYTIKFGRNSSYAADKIFVWSGKIS